MFIENTRNKYMSKYTICYSLLSAIATDIKNIDSDGSHTKYQLDYPSKYQGKILPTIYSILNQKKKKKFFF